MAWHKVDQNLPGHPKTMRLRGLRRHKNTDETSGFMLRLWGWALDVKPDGMIGEVPQALAEALRVRDGEELVRHLAEAGFVCTERCAARGLDPVAHRPGRIHGWDETGGELARQRAADAERKRLVRAHEHGEHPVADVDGCPKCFPRRKASSGQPTQPPILSSGQREDVRAQRPIDRDEPQGVPPWGRDLSSGQDRTGQERPVDASRARTREGDKSRGRVEKSTPDPHAAHGTPGSRRTPPPVAEDPEVERARVRVGLLLEGAAEPWRSVLRTLLEGGTSRANLITWFEGTRLEDERTVVCPNAFTRDWLMGAKAGYARALRGILRRDDLRFVIEDELVAAGVDDEPPVPDA